MTKVISTITSWFDQRAAINEDQSTDSHRIDWPRLAPFLLIHIACVSVLWVGWSWIAVGVAMATYAVRMFAITAFYHRYFSHRSFKTSRAGQFAFALLGSTAGQKGPLWWAAHHRHHHRHSDRESDVHSPSRHGFWWSHVGWIASTKHVGTDLKAVRDFARYAELRFLDRFDIIGPMTLAGGLYVLGAMLAASAPGLSTSGWQMLVWGFCISTVALYHGTFAINSLCHIFGTRRYATRDDSRNNLLLALITLGEGWHNNHHRYPGSTRQGFFWWEINVSYYVLVLMSWLRLVWELQPVPERVRQPSTECLAAGDRASGQAVVSHAPRGNVA